MPDGDVMDGRLCRLVSNRPFLGAPTCTALIHLSIHNTSLILTIHKISGKVVEKYFCDSDLDNLSGTYSILYHNSTYSS